MAIEKEMEVAEKSQVDTDIHQELRSGNWFVPATDVYEKVEEVVLVMDMPGVCFDCAHVSIVDDELVVTGHVTHGEDQDDYVLYREYDVGHYHRHFGLPPTIDRERIEASMNDGVLTVVMPQIEQVRPRRIAVKVAG
ncbi:MAG: Hsp20/alpha crystallin family protein [Chloroflexi bacterium]|nr:MAG: Hsp20/alpha crystallin family protein [Chloroflexota bacterium]